MAPRRSTGGAAAGSATARIWGVSAGALGRVGCVGARRGVVEGAAGAFGAVVGGGTTVGSLVACVCGVAGRTAVLSVGSGASPAAEATSRPTLAFTTTSAAMTTRRPTPEYTACNRRRVGVGDIGDIGDVGDVGPRR